LGTYPHYDLQAGCTGFLYALAQAKAVVETSGQSVLVVGSDALSTGFNWHDRNAVLFGDGAGAWCCHLQTNPAFSRSKLAQNTLTVLH
jgi:3-oxoacyl-[acyl-carrier-protein] synthase III